MSLPTPPPPLPPSLNAPTRIVHAPRVLAAPGAAGRGGGAPAAPGPGLNHVELRKNLNEALLKRSMKAHHSAPGNIGPIDGGGPLQLPNRDRGNSAAALPSALSSPPPLVSISSPSNPTLGASPPVLPPREPLPNASSPSLQPSNASPLRRPPVMLQHAATSHAPMLRSTGSLGGPHGFQSGGGSPARVSVMLPHSGSDGALPLPLMHRTLSAGVSRRSLNNEDTEQPNDRRDSGSWIHKLSLSSIVPRLGELPTDPSLFEKAADPKKHGTVYERCFTGEMFVEWVQSLGKGHSKQEITELGDMLLKSALIVMLAGNDTFGTSKYDVYALETTLGAGMGASALATAMGSLALNKKEQKKKEKLEKKEEEKRLKEAKKQEKAEALKAKKEKSKTIDRKKPKKKATKVFGATLEEVLAQQQGDTADPELAAKYAELEVPIALKLLTDRLVDLNAFRSEGIFRISGTQEEIDKLKAQINDLNYDAIAACGDVNVIAGLMKAFLRELTEPLVPSELYQRCITDGLTDPAKANQLLQELPEANRKTARFVIDFLLRFLNPEHVAVTKMGIENVSMVFAPLFLRNETCDPARMLLNASYESSYVQNLLQFYLGCS